MTHHSVPNPTSALQHSSAVQPQLGRRAYGHQRRMSQATVVRNIVDSIMTNRELGDDRTISHYTSNPDTQALVQAKLDAMSLAEEEV